ncbi:MAG: hypothetical protein R3330_09485, partial [Saprospiraceae bacterium]|nr:hypothetical protein [Saprospiraceae bacterium]
LLYFGVLAVGLLGSLIAYFRPRGMAIAMFATALAQAAVTVAALTAGWGAPANGPAEIIGLNGFFVVLWVASAALFREAARRASEQIEG